MTEDKQLLNETEVKKSAAKFLLAKFPKAHIRFSSTQLVTMDNIEIYQMRGKIAMGSRGIWQRFTTDKNTDVYDLLMEIDAWQGRVVNYELK